MLLTSNSLVFGRRTTLHCTPIPTIVRTTSNCCRKPHRRTSCCGNDCICGMTRKQAHKVGDWNESKWLKYFSCLCESLFWRVPVQAGIWFCFVYSELEVEGRTIMYRRYQQLRKKCLDSGLDLDSIDTEPDRREGRDWKELTQGYSDKEEKGDSKKPRTKATSVSHAPVVSTISGTSSPSQQPSQSISLPPSASASNADKPKDQAAEKPKEIAKPPAIPEKKSVPYTASLPIPSKKVVRPAAASVFPAEMTSTAAKSKDSSTPATTTASYLGPSPVPVPIPSNPVFRSVIQTRPTRRSVDDSDIPSIIRSATQIKQNPQRLPLFPDKANPLATPETIPEEKERPLAKATGTLVENIPKSPPSKTRTTVAPSVSTTTATTAAVHATPANSHTPPATSTATASNPPTRQGYGTISSATAANSRAPVATRPIQASSALSNSSFWAAPVSHTNKPSSKPPTHMPTPSLIASINAPILPDNSGNVSTSGSSESGSAVVRPPARSAVPPPRAASPPPEMPSRRSSSIPFQFLMSQLAHRSDSVSLAVLLLLSLSAGKNSNLLFHALALRLFAPIISLSQLQPQQPQMELQHLQLLSNLRALFPRLCLLTISLLRLLLA